MKKLFIILFVALVGFASTSCDDYLDVNKNQDAPDKVDAYLYLAGLESAWQGMYWDLRATAPLSQMMGTNSYTSYANNFYFKGSDAAGETWRIAYWLHGMNLENMVNQAKADEAWTLAGIGLAIKAYTWDVMCKLQVELPMKQAFEVGRLSHDYDYQDEIYPQIRAWAEEAIELLSKEDNFAYGTKLKENDRVFQGDADKWIKFAHGVIVNNLASLTNKNNFVSEYANQLLQHGKLALSSADDNALMSTVGGAADAQFSIYNNFWGVYRGNLYNYYWQSEYIVQIMTGTVPVYDETTGDKVKTSKTDERAKYYPYELNPKQIIADTLVELTGHYDPRVAAKLSTEDDKEFEDIDDADSVKMHRYYGSSFTSASGPIGTAPNVYGRIANANKAYDGTGRWLFRDDAPYVLMTSAQIKFCMAEAYFKMGDKANALAAWKDAIKDDMDFTVSQLLPGKAKDGAAYGALPGGDKISTALFNQLAAEYLAGPFVGQITESELTLSHIMMQKYVALWPWGANEAWTDLRKYHFDINYAGDYPTLDNGWTLTTVDQKWDTDESKVYKGFYLAPAQVEGRRGTYNVENYGSPCYRIRPRYNSEYMWNLNSLGALKPIAGDALNYQCSIPWFAYPDGYPM